MAFEDDDDFGLSDEGAMSPFEQALGSRWEQGMQSNPAAEKVYESGGAEMSPSDGGYPRDLGNGATQFGPGIVGAPGTTSSPREVFQPDQPTRPIDQPKVTQRSPSSGGDGSDGGGTTNAPARPKTPTPVASMSPEPFSPMQQLDPVGMVAPRDPGAQNVAMRAPSMSAPAMPTSPTPVALRSNPYSPVPMQFADNKRSTGLLGQAGGQLGGGLGVAGSGDGQESISALLQLLLGGDQGESY